MFSLAGVAWLLGGRGWSEIRGLVGAAGLKVVRWIRVCFPEGIDSLAVVGTGMVCGGNVGNVWGGKWAYFGLGVGFLCGICVALLLARCRKSGNSRGDPAELLNDSQVGLRAGAQ